MNELFKSKRRTALAMGALFLAITLISGTAAYFLAGDALLRDPASSSQAEEASPEEDQGDPADPPPEEDAVPAAADLEEEPQSTDDGPIHFNMPGEMRGVMLTPGVDYLLTQNPSAASIKGEIDQALQNAKDLTMNTVIIQTGYKDAVIYHTAGGNALYGDLDIMEYIVTKCRDLGLYAYGVFDASYYSGRSGITALSVGAGSIDRLSANLREYAEKYALDGILLDGYLNRTEEESYIQYLSAGGGIGFGNFMRQSPTATVKTASRVVRTYARGTQVGLLTDGVWENADQNELGSDTKAVFTSLGDGNADTRGFVEEELVDFVAVKAYTCLTDSAEPFKEVVAWWADVAASCGVPMYVVHASDKICTDAEGWQPHDQITKQVIEASALAGYRGSVFNDLSRLVEDPKEAATTLVKYYNNEVEAAHILTELAITKPEQTTFTTFEPIVTFVGASDPNSPVTINDEDVQRDGSGYFTVTWELQAGENRFTIEHKEKTIVYNITRQVQILKEVSPTGNIAAEGGMSITISALAYSDATVSATVGGVTIPMSIDDSMETETDRDSTYKRFFGEFTAPAATESEQSLGNIAVHASWSGMSETMEGAFIKVNKRAKVEDGVPVVVVADQAKTYSPDTLNNIPHPDFYPLPAGAMDYAVGEEIVYKKDAQNTYTYFVLASGLRVESKDISATSDYAAGNAVSGTEITSDGGYTYLRVKTAQKVSYSFRYTGSAVTVDFHYTTQAPGESKVGSNPLFTAAKWQDNTLTLTMTKAGCFMGYKGYYDGGDLILRFNNPPSSLANARIAIDPGHGGNDIGARGFLAQYPERAINLGIAQKLAAMLKERGAAVLLIDNSGGPSLDSRVRQAENWNADILVSVHSNSSASNSAAAGCEAYYFYPFSGTLAATASRNIASQFGTANRGAKRSYYHITLSSQMTSILAECGFVSNKNEYEKLITNSGQSRIATALADAVSASIKAAYPGSGGNSGNGGGSSGSLSESEQEEGIPAFLGLGSESSESSEPDSGGIPIFGSGENDGGEEGAAITSLTLSENEMYMEEEEMQRLKVTVTPKGAGGDVLWKSSNTAVATVDKNGRVVAQRPGRAVVTAFSAQDENVYDECEVMVE